MFTGIVEERGSVRAEKKRGGSVIFSIQGTKTGRSLKKNDSICVDGVCLTVLGKRGSVFRVQAVEETLAKTTLGKRKVGGRVNLERSMSAADRFGGHVVLGHVDGVARVKVVEKRKSSWIFWFTIPRSMSRFLVPQGSVAINGVSLTVARLRAKEFAVSIIPQTWRVTTFNALKANDAVNIECDVLGKYVERILEARRA